MQEADLSNVGTPPLSSPPFQFVDFTYLKKITKKLTRSIFGNCENDIWKIIKNVILSFSSDNPDGIKLTMTAILQNIKMNSKQ